MGLPGYNVRNGGGKHSPHSKYSKVILVQNVLFKLMEQENTVQANKKTEFRTKMPVHLGEYTRT